MYLEEPITVVSEKDLTMLEKAHHPRFRFFFRVKKQVKKVPGWSHFVLVQLMRDPLGYHPFFKRRKMYKFNRNLVKRLWRTLIKKRKKRRNKDLPPLFNSMKVRKKRVLKKQWRRIWSLSLKYRKNSVNTFFQKEKRLEELIVLYTLFPRSFSPKFGFRFTFSSFCFLLKKNLLIHLCLLGFSFFCWF